MGCAAQGLSGSRSSAHGWAIHFRRVLTLIYPPTRVSSDSRNVEPKRALTSTNAWLPMPCANDASIMRWKGSVTVALKKSDLYSSLSKSCDELRGGMDASQYKDYILTLLL